MSNQIWQLSDEAYADLCLRASKYEDLKAELEQIRAEIAEKENKLGFDSVSDVALKTAYIEVLKIIDKAIKEQNE